MRIRSLLLATLLLVPAARGDVKFTVTHTDNGGGWTDPALGKTRRDTLQAVFDYLVTVLDENGEIDFQTLASDYNATGPIASSLPRFPSAPNGFSSGNAFLHARSGVDPNPGSADATITVDWGYSLSPGLAPPPNAQLDLYSVLLHEVTHSLGFLTRINGAAKSAVTNTDPGVYTVLDSWARLGNVAPAAPLFNAGGDYAGTVADLSDNTPGIFFWGTAGVAANSGKPIKLYQTNPHTLGSGLSHTGILMSPTIANNVMKRTYSVRDLGMLRDFGWKIKPQHPTFLGPQALVFLSDPGPTIGLASSDLNDDPSDAGFANRRFGGVLGGFLLDVDPHVPRRVYDEEPSTAELPERNPSGDFTRVNRPDAPGTIALQNRDGRHSSTGLTWISPAENFRVPARSDEKFVVSYRANLTPGLRNAATGTFLDAVVGASSQAITGGAARGDGIGVRINASGPFGGTWQIFDGTGPLPRLEASGLLSRAFRGGGSGWYRVSIELLEPSFDETTPTIVNVLIDGEVVHTFRTRGGIGDNFVSFHAGPAAERAAQPAVYLLDDIDIALEPWAAAPAVVSVIPTTDLQGIVGVPYVATFQTIGGTGPLEWWLDGALPAGLVFHDGVVTGTPLQAGTFEVTVSAVDFGFFVGKITRAIVISE